MNNYNEYFSIIKSMNVFIDFFLFLWYNKIKKEINMKLVLFLLLCDFVIVGWNVMQTKTICKQERKKSKVNANLDKLDDYFRTYVFLGGKK